MENFENIEKINKIKISDKRPNPVKKWRRIVRVVLIVFMFLILTSSYIFLFSGASRDGLIGTRAVGVLNKDNFTNSNLGDLIVIDNDASLNSLTNQDVIVYQLNGEVFSKQVKSVDQINKFVIVVDNGIETPISFNVILGTQEKNIAVIGLIWGFCASTIGVIVISIILLAYVFYITFSRINLEDTEKGAELLNLYKKDKKESKERKKMLKAFKKTQGFDPKDSKIIDGTLGDNLIELMSFTNAEKSGNITDIYNYILEKVYRVYIYKESLSRIDRLRISNVIELCPVVDEFSEEISYKIIDLLLKETLHDFDTLGFEKLALKFLTKELTVNDCLNFGNVLYVLLTKNVKAVNANMKKVTIAYIKAINVKHKDQELINDISMKLAKIFNLKVKFQG